MLDLQNVLVVMCHPGSLNPLTVLVIIISIAIGNYNVFIIIMASENNVLCYLERTDCEGPLVGAVNEFICCSELGGKSVFSLLGCLVCG